MFIRTYLAEEDWFFNRLFDEPVETNSYITDCTLNSDHMVSLASCCDTYCIYKPLEEILDAEAKAANALKLTPHSELSSYLLYENIEYTDVILNQGTRLRMYGFGPKQVYIPIPYEDLINIVMNSKEQYADLRHSVFFKAKVYENNRERSLMASDLEASNKTKEFLAERKKKYDEEKNKDITK